MSPSGVYERKPRPLMAPKQCDVPECDRQARTPGAALCETHYYRVRRTGSVELAPRPQATPKVRRGIPRGAAHPSWVGDRPRYSGAHMRVRAQRGKARDQTCACGARAAQWAYLHDDPDELRAAEGPYSADPMHYKAMCVSCHKRFDLARLS